MSIEHRKWGTGRAMEGWMRVLGAWLLAGFLGCGATSSAQVEVQKVTRGPFVNSVTVTGELEAVHSIMISAPPINWRFGDLKIAQIVDDGTQVKKGDLLIQFDKSEVEKAITDAQSNLEIAEAGMRKAEVQHESEIKSMEIDLKVAGITHQIAKLQLAQANFKAEIDRRQDEYTLKDAAIKLAQAEQQLKARKVIQREETSKLALQVAQAQANLKVAENTLAMLTVTAPAPGIAILQKNRMTQDKFQVDDETYPGTPMIGLPDLSRMEADVEVNEVDIAKIKLGQKATVTLDAYPDTSFVGQVTQIGALAHDESQDVKVKVFDVTVRIDGHDRRLLPGMTVSCNVVVDQRPEVLSVPLVGVFDRDGKTVVYRRSGGGFKAVPVVLGEENDTRVIVKRGLSAGDEIALSDPTLPLVSQTPKKGAHP